MYPPNRSFLTVVGALALGLAVPTGVLAQETPDTGDEPKVEETAQEMEEQAAEVAVEQNAGTQPVEELAGETTEMEEGPAVARAGESLVSVAQELGNLTRFLELVELTGLTSELSDGGPFTIFAPTDDAFAALDQEGSMDEQDVSDLRRLVRTHIAAGEWTSEELTGADEITNLLADELQLDWSSQGGETEAARQVDGADVIRVDIVAGNGVIHEIDAVLSASPAPEMSASLNSEENAGPESAEADDTGDGS